MTTTPDRRHNWGVGDIELSIGYTVLWLLECVLLRRYIAIGDYLEARGFRRVSRWTYEREI